jgi:phage major head subunit gpT-like protein
MTGVITTSSFAKALWPGLNKIFQDMYKMYPEEYGDFTYTVKSDKNREEYLGFSGLGLASIKAEGSPTRFDSMEQGFVPQVQNVSFGLGYIITREARDDNQYMQIAAARTRALARSARITKETVGANMVNRGFNPAFVGADGVELFSAAHITKRGLTYSNTLAVAADLSEASLEQAVIDISLFTDERGLRIMAQPRKLVVPPQLQFEACRILDSELQNDTANNAVNALYTKAVVPGGYAVNHYLTDEDQWQLTTDITDMGEGLIYQERIKDEFASDNEFTTDNAQFKYYGRYAFDWLDPRGAFASPGA